MASNRIAYSLALAFAALLCGLLAGFGWRRRSKPGGLEFALLMAAAALWSLCYSLELLAPSLGGKLVWAKAEYAGIVTIPLAWFLFVRKYTGAISRIPIGVRVLLTAMPAVTFALVVTNGWHGLMWSSVGLDTTGSFPGLVVSHGPWFWVHMIYSYALLAAGTMWLIYRVYRYPQLYRRQAALLTAGAVAPLVGNALLLLGLLPSGSIDPTPFAFVVSGTAFAWSMSRLRFLSLLPALLPTVRSQLFNRMSDGVLVLDADGRVVSANPSVGEMLGTSTAALSGRVAEEILCPGVPGLPPQPDDDSDLQFEVALGTGPQERTYDVISSTLRLPGGLGAGRLLVFRDITERRAAEEQFRKSEAKYRNLYDGMMDAFVQVDMNGDITEFNRAFPDMLGYQPHELLAMRFQDLTPEQWHRYEDHIVRKQVLPRGYSDVYEKEYRRKDGTVFPVELRTELITDATGNPVGMWAIVRDITESKKTDRSLGEAEEQLRQAQKMEAVGQLAGGIAHDFNNQLTAIIGYADLALEAEGDDCPGRADVLEIIKAAEHAKALTRQILAFSRRQTLQPRVVSLNDIVLETSSLLRRTLGEDIDLLFRPESDLGLTEIDPGQLQQVLLNLAVNARSAMPAGGRLTVETANVQLSPSSDRGCSSTTTGRHVLLAVRDNGCGMDTEIRRHIFEPFFTTKAQGEGTGLGLATVYGIVRQSGGTISVYSEPGRGTTFKIYLPRVEACPMPADPPSPGNREAPGGREAVLVVEDEVAVRSLVSRILSRHGYSVLKAGEGEEAGRMLDDASVTIDLLLTDVMLPGRIQGHILAGMARAARPELPVLFMSGYTYNALAHEGRLDEGINFIEKPFTAETLTLKVRGVLDGSPA